LGTFPNDRMIYTFLVRNPDLVSCKLQPQFGETDPISKVELRLLDPSGTPVAGAGGNDQQSFNKVALPGRGSTAGLVTEWKVEVEGAAEDATSDGYKFSLICNTGNGIAYPRLLSEGLVGLF
jgi:hypothetical protein